VNTQMSIRRPRLRRPLAVAAVLGLAVLCAGPTGVVPAFADGNGTTSGKVAVTNTETVQIYTDANGKVDSQRVYEQLTLDGHGSVDLANPISTSGLRNLDGFGGFTVRGGDQIVDTSVDGEKALRTVSDYTSKAPLSVAVHYTLNGKPVSAGDVLGKSGHLKVTYTVTNTSGVPQALHYSNGNGGTVTKTVDVPIPMVASLAVTTPDSYHNVTSTAANMGGDGHGGMMLSFTMTLLPPVGPASSSVSYEADITDGVIPRAELTALPVDPLTNPTFASAAQQYKGGADQGTQLTGGALKLNGGLVKLHDGASQLLSGLIKLHNGAGQLRAGLQGQAAPGAQKLAAGTTQLVGGMDQLNAGGTKLNAGASKLHGGMQQLDSGATKLNAGAAKLHTGTGQALNGGEQLANGLAQLVNGLTKLAGTPQAPGLTAAPSAIQSTILYLETLQSALGSATPAGQCTPSTQSCTILGGLASLDATISDAQTLAGKLGDSQLTSDLTTMTSATKAMSDKVTTLMQPVLASVTASLTGFDTQLEAAKVGLVGDPAHPDRPALLPGAQQALSGAKQLAAGLGKLNRGSGQLLTGTGQLSAGSGQLLAGSGQLLTGTGQLSTGLGQADGGAHQLDSGAHQLSTGLGTAASGTAQLDDGLGQAAAGAPKIRNGLTQASQQGSTKIAQAGESTAQQFGLKYAELAAEAQRAHHQSMAYGAPAGAIGLTAYDWIIQGADGHGTRERDRMLMLGGVLLLGGGGTLLRRRLLG